MKHRQKIEIGLLFSYEKHLMELSILSIINKTDNKENNRSILEKKIKVVLFGHWWLSLGPQVKDNGLTSLNSM